MIKIKSVSREDIHKVYELGKDVPEFHTSDQAPNFWPEDILENAINTKDVYFFAAFEAENLVGFIIANCNRSLSKVLIENIFVHPDYRGNGIGLKLAEKVVAVAKSERFQFISVLTPPDDQPAIDTYQKAGFNKGETFLWLDIA